MKDGGIGLITAANCAPLSPLKHCTQGDDCCFDASPESKQVPSALNLIYAATKHSSLSATVLKK